MIPCLLLHLLLSRSSSKKSHYDSKLYILENIALLKSASQSSGDFASRAVDGSTVTSYPSGSCTHTNTEIGWWRVDFGKSARVHSVKITNRGELTE